MSTPPLGSAPNHNILSAYLHVLANALTSVLAILALVARRFYGWNSMDPLMGIVGALVIARWSWGLVRSSALVLLDAVPDHEMIERVRNRMKVKGDRVCDLHLWRLNPSHFGAIVAVVSEGPKPAAGLQSSTRWPCRPLTGERRSAPLP